MRKKKIVYIIAISAFSLVGLVILQISWILHAAKLQESQLKHRITMASYRVGHRLSQEKPTVEAISQKLDENKGCQLSIQLDEMAHQVIDSLIKQEFRYHQLDLDYKFEIVDREHRKYASTCQNNINAQSICLDEVTAQAGGRGELRISFLNIDSYIYAQMGSMLFASFVFISLVIACFGLTIKTIWKQKRMSEMTTDFINNMTHELKTPISTISLASNMLRRERVLDQKDKIIHYSGIIHEENAKLQNQVEHVLRIARIEKGEFKLNKERANVHDLVQEAIRSFELQIISRNGQIRCYFNALRQEVVADVNHLTNVISNLIDNANKYSLDHPEITVSTYNRDRGVVISVEDKGIGMSKDKQKYIFNKFYRVSTGNIHDVKGFGLGLAYVKMMIDAHKGQINLNSEPGKGSRFDIYIPFGTE
ncbi:MAG: HAMP domain-containing sensor histidine kinase [Microscillaceae bacterium]|nr:HAMP domain-containing sensor histidine kinase [Microscillaceae bacterium]